MFIASVILLSIWEIYWTARACWKAAQAKDLERFRWFSNDYLAVDRDDTLLVVDMRYSHLPNEIKGLWGIRVDPNASVDEHVTWIARRSADSERFQQLWAMLKGN